MFVWRNCKDVIKCIKSEKEEKKNQICPQAGNIDWQQQGRVEGLRLRGENCQKRSFLNVLCDAQSSQWYCGEEERGAYFLDCILKDKKEYINSYGLLHWAMGGDRDIYYIRFLILIDTFFLQKKMAHALTLLHNDNKKIAILSRIFFISCLLAKHKKKNSSRLKWNRLKHSI